MDRAHTYVAGSRHKDNCHFFCNQKEIDELSGLLDRGIKPNHSERIVTLARLMSEDRYKTLAIEHLKEDQIELLITQEKMRESSRSHELIL